MINVERTLVGFLAFIDQQSALTRDLCEAFRMQAETLAAQGKTIADLQARLGKAEALIALVDKTLTALGEDDGDDDDSA